MSIYAIWNNKGGVGKSYLTFQIASEYARTNPMKKVLVVDLCPQANVSSMFLGGIVKGEEKLTEIHTETPKKTISGYINDRILSPYITPKSGSSYITKVREYNEKIPENLFLVVGDEQLEIQSSKVVSATYSGPSDAWRIVNLWISDLISDIKESFEEEVCVFIDCNPSFSIYTQLALSSSERLIIPFSADGSSKRAVRAVLALAYGVRRYAGDMQSDFFLNAVRYNISLPQIYMFIGNRLTQMNNSSAGAFKTVVNEIGDEIWNVWKSSSSSFCVHTGANSSGTPTNRKLFKKMFQYEVNDANTASVVSGALGVPISFLKAGNKTIAGKLVSVNQSQLDKQVPNIEELVENIE